MTNSLQKIIKKKKITFDDFAAMCMREFTRIHEKLRDMDARLDTSDGRFDAIDARLDATDKVVNTIGGTLIATRKDIVELGNRMDKRFDRFENVLTNHTFRIERLERAVELD